MSTTKADLDTSGWVDNYSDILYNYAITRVNDHELSKDLVQDTFVSALKGLASFKGESSVKTWLFSILKRKIIDHWRKQESRKTKPMSQLGNGEQSGEEKAMQKQNENSFSEIEVNYDNMELRDAIMGCIQDLPEKWKGIIIDKLVEEKKSEEVCKEHDITPSNLWVIVHRAKVQLRECLSAKWLNT
ncbi:sigma-70 family RNA polymerase sigma factor [Paracrocinitomix mangrovi]|uniref:RNA polymerase sigma factor n=1 Tax=Paracrocinitomix mangrovi TaxID=2862509 RepID=UPI001C8E0BC0|nr:sigma-70 family RNA polymerase sigma factor [Paracrocinitomix mangrovi]UKN02984.1 sigma-70 family RNA polymerase sigma factor [Paracrocinitomix mangrovi]